VFERSTKAERNATHLHIPSSAPDWLTSVNNLLGLAPEFDAPGRLIERPKSAAQRPNRVRKVEAE